MKAKNIALLATVILCGIAFFIWNNKANSEGLPEIVDEGGAAKRVVLRFRSEIGTQTYNYKVSYKVPSLDKSGTLSGKLLGRTLPAKGNSLTTEVTMNNLVVERDELGIAGAIRAKFPLVVTATYDTQGNLLAQRGIESVPSYAFPKAAVEPGDTWQGFEVKKGRKQKLTFTLERIVKSGGHDIAVIAYNYPTPAHQATDWLDTQTGSIIHSIDTEHITLPTGNILQVHTEVE